MALASPIATNFLNSPSHSKGHNVFNWDTAAPNNSIIVDSSGNVGIGTTGPGDNLVIAKDSNVYLHLDSNTDGNYESALKISNYNTGSNFWWTGINNESDYSIHYGTSMTAANSLFHIETGGNVGIGTTSPTSLLHLSSTGDIFSTIDRGTTGHGGRLKFATAGVDEVEIGLSSLFGSNNFGISDGSANPKMVVNVSTGNVGIGITSPTAVLHLKAGTATANTASLKIDAGVVATTPVSGNIESDGTNLYWTDSGGTRRQLNNA